MAHAVRHADEVEAQRGVFKAMRQELGATAFGVNQLQLGSGAEGPEHDHSADGQEEVYVIIGGSGKVIVDGESYLFTDFEPADARSAWPCFDEPSFKIPWRVSLTVPAGAKVVGNMPIAKQKNVDTSTEVTFATAERASDVPLIGVGSGMFPGCHHRPRGFSVDSVSLARRT